MKRFALLAAAFGLAFAAVAQTAAPVASEPAPQAAAAQVDGSVVPEKSSTKNDLADRNCLKETGSRVIRADSKGRKCANATGRAYNRGDIDRTGAVELKDALRKLDPAVH